MTFRKFKLGEVANKIGSGATPRGGKDAYLPFGDYSLIRSQNVLDFTFSNDGLAFLSEDQASKLNNVAIEKRDILLNITGDSVARVCQVPFEILPARVNQHVAIIRPNHEFLNPEFLKYYLLNPTFKVYMLMLSSSGATRNAITKSMIENFEIKTPDLPTQAAIAEILSSLDDKIELNNQINQNLEALAQALFKQWFVDFEFPFDFAQCKPSKNGKPYKSSGGEMVDSELGMIPKGWRVDTLDKLLTVKYGKDHKHIPDGQIPIYGSGGIMRYGNKSLYDKISILIPRKGTLSNLFLVEEPFWSVDTMFYTEINSDEYAEYLYYQIKSFGLASMNVGSAVPSMTTKVLNQLLILNPCETLIKSFHKATKSILDVINANKKEDEILKNLRNILLPKLISGDLFVPPKNDYGTIK